MSDRPLRYIIATMGVVLGTLMVLPAAVGGHCGSVEAGCTGGNRMAWAVLAIDALVLGWMFYRYRHKPPRRRNKAVKHKPVEKPE